jgi:hypothetical protein
MGKKKENEPKMATNFPSHSSFFGCFVWERKKDNSQNDLYHRIE